MSGSHRLTLLRHGETASSGLLGQHDAPLSARGRQQMQQRWRELDAVDPVRAIATSDLARCRDFATGMATPMACHIDMAFRELACGALDGRNPAALGAADARAWQQWQTDPANTLPGGEDWAAFTARIDAGLRRWLAGDGAGGHHVLVTHGGVIKALLLHWLGLPPARHGQFWPGHAASISVWWDPDWPPVLLDLRLEAP
ncbi:histidine phosphatase family protein [Jeongeupia chitinilytica]|uniref:Histidine phosphatase family protein n=1 Tax=Jeongeupia chitinilytica TaxID=1041641 RepID=A0ABQ3H366_9NEIS|nr:histidine phosphatase family protein [Jeongeupia chitinilytica]GHD67944.1 hypothetical protein GCM10007350_32380 [Jeongeupia chitinilytica]